ncbi:MAG: hypothetical protein WD991_01860 [Candidatus Paceibacterota bacterium]
MSETFRSKELNDKYLGLIKDGFHDSGCNLCKAPSIKEWDHWRVIDNLFPYDLIAKTHHMLIPKKHAVEEELTGEELAELKKLKQGHINENYGWIMEAVPKIKSVPSHFHLHLINSKFDYE